MEINNNKNLTHYQLVEANQKQRELKSKKYTDGSKKRLSNIIATKVKTSFIGAISACEDHFGVLWGHGKQVSELNESEAAMREVWEEVRANILDNGNTQLRAIISEIGEYSINWDRYKIVLPANETEENEEN